MKLGEMLVKEGKITSAELEETLRGQAIFGGRFGTNLVEMGFLDEEELAYFLSRKTGVPCASPDDLMNVPPQVISLLPEETVKKYRVIPVALNNRKLSLAMTDPTDYATIDEISFATGYIVVPLITPELRLVLALEKYYNIRRDLRYIPVAGGGRGRGRGSQAAQAAEAAAATPAAKQASATPAGQQPPPKAPPAVEPEDNDFFELLPLEEIEGLAELEEVQTQIPRPATLAPPTPAAAQPVPSPQAPPVTPSPIDRRLEAEKDFSMAGVQRGLTQAEDRHAIAELLIGYTTGRFGRAALFMVKGEQAIGWVAQVGGKQLPDFEALEVSLREPSVLKVVTDSKTVYLGPIPISPANSRIFSLLGGPPSLNQLFAPLLMMGRVVAILYVDGGNQPLGDSTLDLQKLLSKASMAFEILILKSKILMT